MFTEDSENPVQFRYGRYPFVSSHAIRKLHLTTRRHPSTAATTLEELE